MENKHDNVSASLLQYICEGTPGSIVKRYATLPRRAREGDFGVFEHNVVVVDTETTGVSFVHDELIQIAAARMDHTQISSWYTTFVNPSKTIPEEISHLTGITENDIADAPTPDEALEGLVDFVGDAFILAHNAPFDKTFTTKHPAGHPLRDNVWIDSLDLARIALPRMKSHRLLDLVRAFDAPISTHRADADVEATCALFRILLAAIDAMPKPLARFIADLAPNEWSTSVVFDKLAGYCDDVLLVQKLRKERTGNITYQDKLDTADLAVDPLCDLVFPQKNDVAAAFSETGMVGSLYDHYEERPEQLKMAQAVQNAFALSQHLLVEAGTGTGKSMAYLVPSVLTAQQNDISVGVATKTNALLDQLMHHELPLLAKRVPELKFAALKGFSHYVCLRKVDALISMGARMKEIKGQEETQAPAIAGLLSFIEQTKYGDIDTLKIDFRRLPRTAFTTTSRECLRRACSYYGTMCYVHGARRAAEAADIVVTNHSLLLHNLAAEGSLLPPVRYWVVDEAHSVESEARRAFSITLAADELLRLTDRLSSDQSTKNPLVRIDRLVMSRKSTFGTMVPYALMAKTKAAGVSLARAAENLAVHIKDLLFFDTSKKNKGYETLDLWINADVRNSEVFTRLVKYGASFVKEANLFIQAAQEIVALLESYEDVLEPQKNLALVILMTKELSSAIEIILSSPSQEYAYAAHLFRRSDNSCDELQALPLEVGSRLGETLFAQSHSIVLTSATLMIDGSFSTCERALGFTEVNQTRVHTLAIDSSYDYDQQMTIYVACDMPEPNNPSYLASLERFLCDLHKAQHGSLLTLFTNRREMEKCFDTVQPEVKKAGLRIVCQKWGVSTKGLRDDFLADEHLSLFALKSFWEGFDAPGATLKGVVIPKLPFVRPTDPLSQERAERDEAAWRHYVLPAAILDVRQAAGRLIRSASDTGILVFADSRVATKNYGRTFLNSLPSSTIKTMSCAQIVQDVATHTRELLQ